jgi:type IV pilus assembly protein PilC
MATFAYRAIDEEGQMQRGNLDAVNAVDLELRLKRMGLDLIRFDPVKKSALFSQRISRKELITFCFHLDQLMRAGVPIIDALTDLRDTIDHPPFRQVVASLLEDIEGGQNLSGAMASHPEAFDDVFVALIRTGEAAGELPSVLAELAENLKWQDEFNAQVRSALVYPVVAGTIVLAAVLGLMIFLVPQFGVALKAMTNNPPPQTLAIIAVSKWMREYWYLLLGVPAAAAIIFTVLAKTNEAFKFQLDELVLQLPYIGPLVNKVILARFSTYFALMYRAGIGVLDCIHISEKVVGNRVVEQGLQRVGRDINEGAGISQAFQGVRLFPPLVLRMLRVGESTGGLDTALMNVSYFYNRDVRESLARLQEMIQPTLTVLLGGVVIVILLTVFLPLYDVFSKITTVVR